MLTTIFDTDGNSLNAKVEVEDYAIIVHSRGGAFGKPNLRNPDYRQALRTILERLMAGGATLSGVWLDSAVAQNWPEPDRQLLDRAELALPVDELVTLIGQRGAAKGRPSGTKGHGNSTKRVRIGISGALSSELLGLLNQGVRTRQPRLQAETLRRVEPWMIDEAIEAFKSGVQHGFQGSTDYDVLLPTGERLPPKAIFGIALSGVIGRPAMPSDFSGGIGTPCFESIEDAGYPIIPKDEETPSPRSEFDDERSWAEGSTVRVTHLRRERAPGLARTKKRRFIEQHGHLFCERCGLIPSKCLGPFGDACIEVHHDTVAVAKMEGKTRTRLADLRCLCANCHRIVHRETL
ncbi:HNH endonuclease [Ensifer sp. LBL]|uniref:HNH endonuclease n=1 Tax=Ensifer sp. LBL TaxID=2991056 RepID=UPI003D257106